ncbi:XkdW family protein [Clostridium niameyense]|uniref:XkdW family protein n=1 Tax=Clostridium niameyense TaxID=1622073 RepID=UPI00067F14D6|nr:XkdW family protein [Clostridium niameyense]
MIKKQYVKDEFLFIEYDSGASVKVPFQKEPSEAIRELPKNPILELQKQVNALGKELSQAKVENIKKDSIINTLGKELAQVKIQLAGGNK